MKFLTLYLPTVEQWGNTTASSDGFVHQLTYPIAVSHVRAIVATHVGGDTAMLGVISNYTSNHACAFKIRDFNSVVGAFSLYFIIIGE